MYINIFIPLECSKRGAFLPLLHSIAGRIVEFKNAPAPAQQSKPSIFAKYLKWPLAGFLNQNMKNILKMDLGFGGSWFFACCRRLKVAVSKNAQRHGK